MDHNELECVAAQSRSGNSSIWLANQWTAHSLIASHRANCYPKLIGAQLLAGNCPLDGFHLLLGGRASFELLQKALVARIPIVAAVGVPSSLAVSQAAAFNMTLLGFVRLDGFDIYTGAERIARAALLTSIYDEDVPSHA